MVISGGAYTRGLYQGALYPGVISGGAYILGVISGGSHPVWFMGFLILVKFSNIIKIEFISF